MCTALSLVCCSGTKCQFSLLEIKLVRLSHDRGLGPSEKPIDIISCRTS